MGEENKNVALKPVQNAMRAKESVYFSVVGLKILNKGSRVSSAAPKTQKIRKIRSK